MDSLSHYFSSNSTTNILTFFGVIVAILAFVIPYRLSKKQAKEKKAKFSIKILDSVLYYNETTPIALAFQVKVNNLSESNSSFTSKLNVRYRDTNELKKLTLNHNIDLQEKLNLNKDDIFKTDTFLNPKESSTKYFLFDTSFLTTTNYEIQDYQIAVTDQFKNYQTDNILLIRNNLLRNVSI